MDDIALSLDSHTKALHEMLLRLGPILPGRVADALTTAADIARDGMFEISIAEKLNVTREARSAAEKMYDLLGTAVSELRADLERSGVKLA